MKIESSGSSDYVVRKSDGETDIKNLLADIQELIEQQKLEVRITDAEKQLEKDYEDAEKRLQVRGERMMSYFGESSNHVTRRSNKETEIERLFAKFQGGMPKELQVDDLVHLVSDAVNQNVYNRIPLVFENTTENNIKIYRENREFWKNALNSQLIHGDRIKLIDFNIIEWIPSSPGRYFTNKAIQSRINAFSYRDGNEYLPIGKGQMILGGVGSVRLATRIIHNHDVYILCGTSNGISHQGIPLILDEEQYDRIAPFIGSYGGGVAEINGRIKIFSINDSPIQFDQQIPKYGIFVDDLTIKQPSENLLVSVTISYSEQSEYVSTNNPQKYKIMRNQGQWSFCSFDPGKESVNSAVNWLQRYAWQHSRSPRIISDFDEHHNHFDHFGLPIEFPLRNTMNGNINRDFLDIYQKALLLKVNGGLIIMNENHIYNVEQAGAVGPNSRAENFVMNQNNDELNVDFEKLAQELTKLQKAMKEEANTDEQDIAIGNIALAKKAVQEQNKKKINENLKKAGKWALDVATKIGATIATEAIKNSLG